MFQSGRSPFFLPYRITLLSRTYVCMSILCNTQALVGPCESELISNRARLRFHAGLQANQLQLRQRICCRIDTHT